jgi:PAS domain S-box-containing protein
VEIRETLAPMTDGQKGILVVAHDVTERKRSEQVLRESELSYRGLFDSVTEAIYIQTAEGRFLDVNQGAEKMYGHRREYFLGLTPADLAAPGRNDMPAVVSQVGRAFAGEPQQFEFWGRRSNGEPFLKEVFLNRGLYFGQPVIIAAARDITERKRAEEELKKSLSLLEATLESTADGILVADGKGQMVRFNQKFIEMWRLPAELASSRDDYGALELVLAQLSEPDQFLAKVRELYAQPEALSFDVLKFKDGRIFERLSQPQKVGGEIIGRVWSFRDITERKRAEQHVAVFARVAEELNTAATVQEAGHLITQAADELLGFDSCWLELFNHTTGHLVPVVRCDLVDGRRTQIPFAPSEEDPSPRFCSILREGKRIILRQPENPSDPTTMMYGDKSRRSASLLYACIRHGGDAFGVLSIHSYTFDAYDAAALETLQTLADHCAGALQRIHTVEALRESEALHYSLVENLRQYIFRKDAGGRFTFANGPFCRSLGKSLAEILGRTDFDFFPAKLAAKYQNDDERVLRTGEPVEDDETFCGADGEIISIHVLKTPLRDATAPTVAARASAVAGVTYIPPPATLRTAATISSGSALLFK